MKPRGNIGGTVAGAVVIASSPQEDMAAFDRLPPSVRARLRDMPVKISAEQMAQGVDLYGEQAAAIVLDRFVARHFTGYRPV